MKCTQVKILLADYLDNLLSDRESSMVKEHVAICSACREELEFLKAYKSYAATLKKIKAPDDLLANIHKRIEESAEKKGILRKLFFPLQIKLPIEFAGVCLLSLIAFFLFYPFSPEKTPFEESDIQRETTRRPEMSVGSASAPGLKSETAPLAKGSEDKPRAREEQERYAAERSTVPMETERAAQEKTGHPKKSAGEKASRPQILEISLHLSQLPPMIAGAEIQESAKTSDRKDESKAGARLNYSAASAQKEKKAETGKDTSSADETPPRTSIEDIARSVSGMVIEKNYDRKSGFPKQIKVEIPASNFKVFIEKISAAWLIKKQSPEKPQENLKRIRIVIYLDR